MRILGIDPGSNATGYGVIERREGRVVHVAHGVLRLGRADGMERRLAQLHAELLAVIEAHQPDAAVVERAFVGTSARSALVLGQARGVALAAVASRGVSVHELSPREIKKAVVGTGNAEKRQVQFMVARLLELEGRPAADAADALAAAICHVNSAKLRGLDLTRNTSGRRRRARAPSFVVRRAR